MSTNPASRNPGLTIHAPLPSRGLPRAQSTATTSIPMSMTPYRDGFSDIVPLTSMSDPRTAGPNGVFESIHFESPRPSPREDGTPYGSTFDNALKMNIPSSYSQDTISAYAYSGINPSAILAQGSGSTTREGSPAEPISPFPMSIAPSALHQPSVTVANNEETQMSTSSSVESSEMDEMLHHLQGGGKWHPGYNTNTTSFASDIQMDIDFQGFSHPMNGYYNPAPYGQTYLQQQPQMDYQMYAQQQQQQPAAYPTYNLFVQPTTGASPLSSSPHLSNHSSPLNPPSSTTSSPLITRHSLHQRGHSTTSLYSGMANMNMNMLAPSPPSTVSPSLIATPSPEAVEETYSSYGHSRHASASTSFSMGNMTVGQWAESYKPGLGKSIDGHIPSSLSPPSTSSSSTTADKKRKRTSKHVHQPSISSIHSFTTSTAEEEDGDEEDEYRLGGEDSEGSDDEFEMRKRGGRKTVQKVIKKRRTTPSDEGDDAQECQSKYSSAASASNDYGSQIKVTKLIPIDRSTKSCPHCGFIPSNGRFSDLKRHHGKHLVDEAGEKERWVCTLCGDIHEEDIIGSNGERRRVRVWYPKKGLASSACKKYTRKDSAKRHWVKEHGDKGVVWDPSHLEMADIVKEEMD